MASHEQPSAEGGLGWGMEWLEMGITEAERFGGCLTEAYSPLVRTMFQRVRIAGRVLPGNLRKIQSQGLPSFLYASKRCSSRPDHRLCLLVLEWLWSSSLEHSSSSALLRSGSLSLKPSLLDGSLLRDTRALASTALPSWVRVCVALTWL
jgi:hypothetical protein